MRMELLLPITSLLSKSIKSKALEKVTLRRAMFSGMYKLLWVLQEEVEKQEG